MKLIIFSDVHANIWALDRMLQEEKEYDRICFAGDLVDYGTEPSETIDKVRQLKNSYIVYGNHDQHLLRVHETENIAALQPECYKWVHYDIEKMKPSDFSYLQALKEHQSFECDGWHYLVQHQYTDGYAVIESREAFNNYWETSSAPQARHCISKRRMIFGHTHRQCIHVLDDGMEWLNPGSLSYRRPDDHDKTAQYMVVTDGKIEMKQILYNRKMQYEEAERMYVSHGMKLTEIQDFCFFFGNASTSRDPVPFKK